MAVVKVPKSCVLGIKVQTGVNATGNPVYKTVHFSSVKPAATDADLFAVAQALAALQTYPLNSLIRTDNADLLNQ